MRGVDEPPPKRVPRQVPHLLLAVVLAACAGQPDAAVGDGRAGPVLVVELGDDGYVRLDGERMTFERMLYEVRVAVRAADGDGDRLPWLDVRSPRDPGADAETQLRRLQDEAYNCGVRHLELSVAEG